jgi:hypothetical protein
MKRDLTVVLVDYRTAVLSNIVIESFKKHLTKDFTLRFLVIENDESYDLYSLLRSKDNVRVIRRRTDSNLSHAHGEGLELAKSYVDTDYVFTCHSDVCVTSETFYDEILKCIEEQVALAGVCIDSHPGRVGALHCSGLLVRSDIFKQVSLMPDLPKIDTADKLTLFCREKELKTKLFRNTYNNLDLVDICDSPFRELGKACGVDRCLDSNDRVMFIHQGRGTTKKLGENLASGKLSTEDWINLTLPYTETNSLEERSSVTYSDVISNRRKVVDKFPTIERKNRVWHPFFGKRKVLHFGSGNVSHNAHRELCSIFKVVTSCDLDSKTGADYHVLDDISEKFDLIVAEHVFEHITPQDLIDSMADKISSRLEDGGHLLVTIPNLMNFVGYFADFDHKNLAPPVDIAAIFCCFGLEVVDFFRWSKVNHMIAQQNMNETEKMLEAFLEKHYGLQADKYITMVFQKNGQI